MLQALLEGNGIRRALTFIESYRLDHIGARIAAMIQRWCVRYSACCLGFSDVDSFRYSTRTPETGKNTGFAIILVSRLFDNGAAAQDLEP